MAPVRLALLLVAVSGCVAPADGHWLPKDFPLGVQLDILDEVRLEEARFAMSWFNGEMGEAVFVEDALGPIYVYGRDDLKFHSDHIAGSSQRYWDWNGEIYAAEVRVRTDSPDPIYREVAHELGHTVFGLSHDTDSNSIMYEFVDGPLEERTYITEQSREYLLDQMGY